MSRRRLSLDDIAERMYNPKSTEVEDILAVLASELSTTKTRVGMLEEEIYDYKKKLARYK